MNLEDEIGIEIELDQKVETIDDLDKFIQSNNRVNVVWLSRRFVKCLGIEYPVFQGGMAWIADGKLAAAVSDGGGLGIIAAGNASGDYVRAQIRAAGSITLRKILLA